MSFQIVGKLKEVEVIAKGLGVKERKRLGKMYGRGVWRKMKGISSIKLNDGALVKAELHWYESWFHK